MRKGRPEKERKEGQSFSEKKKSSQPCCKKEANQPRQENQENRGLHKNNTSGHKHIYWNTDSKKWFFRFQGRNKILKRFKNKIDAIHYKFYYLLKINYNKKFDK